ncbi:hypothetical protein OAO87_01620 [bacterium]|nr:hypothetical protein [bacterium]
MPSLRLRGTGEHIAALEQGRLAVAASFFNFGPSAPTFVPNDDCTARGDTRRVYKTLDGVAHTGDHGFAATIHQNCVVPAAEKHVLGQYETDRQTYRQKKCMSRDINLHFTFFFFQ